MNLKELIHQLRRKIRFELWFLVVLVLIAVVAFVLIKYVFGELLSSLEKIRYEVSPLEEKVIYDGSQRDLKEDFLLLLKPQPSNLNGALIRQNVSKGQTMAVVIENYTPIRDQQIGLEGAAIVYESPTEGGITRFLVLYDGEPVELIGPVRSARPYFISWASEYRAGFVHVGGSPAAIANLKSNFRIFNIDEFADSRTVWRDYKYSAPHNAFTSTNKILQRLNEKKYYHPLNVKRFPFKDPDEESGDIRVITIDFSLPAYEVKYEYDPDTHRYVRHNGGDPHHNIQPSNVVVQFVDTKVLDDIGRLYIQTNGTGKALVFRDGKVIEGTWEKDASINSPDQSMSESFTKFFDKNGNEIELNRGQTWIEIVPNNRPVNYF